MTKRTRLLLAAGAVAVAAISAPTIAGAAGLDGDTPITGDALVKASEAALAHIGSGSVTDTEVGDEDSYYEVEVTLPDGRQVDVQLDEGFNVVGADPDTDSGTDDGAGRGG